MYHFSLNVKFIFTTLLIIIINSFFNSVQAQNLLSSRKSSHYTYVFKISDEEAKDIYASQKITLDAPFFHTLIDSFPTGETLTKKLTTGHYLNTYSDKNHQKAEITTVQNLQVFILNNYRDLVIQLYDLEGNIISDAEVKVKNKKLHFDESIQAFILKKTNKKGLLSIHYQSHTGYYYLQRQYNNSAFRRSSNFIMHKTPLQYAWKPVEFVVHIPIDGVKSISDGWSQGTIRQTELFFVRQYQQIVCLFDKSYCNQKPKYYEGYLVFNKPKFRPGDTVKFKSFIVNKNGKPYKKPVEVRLVGPKVSTYLATINPYDPGGYTYQFHLHDSLNLRLDSEYTISLEDETNNNVMNNSFYYQDYELGKNKLQLRVPHKNHYRNQNLEVFIEATDENELTLPDARVEILVQRKKVLDYWEDFIFIPDTLDYIERRLETTSETKIEINDSLFPAANFEYEIIVKLLTSDNELVTQKEWLTYYYLNESLEMSLEQDSIQVVYKKNGLSTSRDTEIYGVDNFGNETWITQGETPFTFPLDSWYASYIAVSGDQKLTYTLSNQASLLQVLANRTKDSIKLEVYNPRNLYFNYHIYLRNKLLSSGYTNDLQIYESLASLENYQLSLQYIWGGMVKDENISIPVYEKALTISVNQPELVYPGQKTSIELFVTDFDGNPVEGVDITAYGLTKKFTYQPPQLPYLGKRRPNRNWINTFYLHSDKLTKSNETPLDFEFWKSLAGIDSIEFYKFLYPREHIYKTSFATNDSITQFAPFVFSNGIHIPIHVIYVDNKPVFFSWTSSTYPYSFRISPGYHQITLRTSQREYTVDNLYFPENHKLIFSFDEGLIQEGVTVEKVKNKLSENEIQLFSRYLMPYRNNLLNNYVYLENENNIHLLSPVAKNSYFLLAGPVTGQMTLNYVPSSLSQEFVLQPYFEYEFQGNMFLLRNFNYASLFPKFLYQYSNSYKLDDFVLTPTRITNFYESSISSKRKKNNYFYNTSATTAGYGQLKIEIENQDQIHQAPLNIILFDSDNSQLRGVFSGNTREFHQLQPGNYQLFLVFPEKKYHSIDAINIQANGISYLRITLPEELATDNVSINLDEIIQKLVELEQIDENQRDQSLEKINSVIIQHYYGNHTFLIEGSVVDDTGFPLPGANVMIQGTTIGTQTDFDGLFSIYINPGDKLLISYVGFASQEVNPLTDSVHINLTADNSLSQVVVTSYYKKSNNKTVPNTELETMLQGQIAGVQITKEANIVKIRGMGSLTKQAAPLYLVNGNVFTGDINTIKSDQILHVEVLDSITGMAQYGSRAANGAVLITLREEGISDLLMQNQSAESELFYTSALEGSSLRQNFSDYALWQPQLKSDSSGKVQFDVVFPDDITQWEIFYLAMNGKKQTGQINKSIKSYKPLMSQLALPRFLIANDTTFAIGKTLNYTDTEQEVTITFQVNDSLRFQKKERIETAVIDTLLLTARDTISVTYRLEKEDGYLDGELREIPIYPAGLLKTEGQFLVLDHNRKMDLSFVPEYGPVTLYARADVLEVLEEEINHVISYRYLCNEQVASKLKMLLAQKKLAEYQQIPFTQEKLIHRYITLLIKNQKPSGLWGWWKNSPDSYWISFHVLEALTEASKQGYKISLDTSNTVRELIWRLEAYNEFGESYRILKILKLLEESVDYNSYINKLENQTHINFHQRLLLTELQQTHGRKYELDSILKHKKTTLFGNVYYDAEYTLTNTLNNPIQNTLLVYKILQRDTLNHQEELLKIRNFFLEKRQSGAWQNTYESAKIVETILDEFLQAGKPLQQPILYVEGAINQTIEQFPWEYTLVSNAKLSVYKTGDFPVYLTGYQSFWESNPVFKSDDFTISTRFEKEDDFILTSGSEVTLLVQVDLKKDAEYIMINVPIPGGCSYATSQPKYKFETHRENFKNEATIFCDKLPRGVHYFEVKLIPRYTGKYTLNPAKIEMMYFPTFNANEVVKKVTIQ